MNQHEATEHLDLPDSAYRVHEARMFLDEAYRNGTFDGRLNHLTYVQLMAIQEELDRFADYEEGSPILTAIRSACRRLFKRADSPDATPLASLKQELDEAIQPFETAREAIGVYLASFIDYVSALDRRTRTNNVNEWTLRHLIEAAEAQIRPQVNCGIICISVNESFEANLAFVKEHIITAMHMHHLNRGRR